MFRGVSRSPVATLKKGISIIAAVGLGALFLVLVLFKVSPVIAFGSVLVLGILLALIVWPDVPTLIFLFVIYSNIAVAMCYTYGLNPAIAAAAWLFLLIPFGFYTIVRRQRVVVDYVLLLMLFFLVCLLVSYFVAIDKGSALKWIVTYFIEGIALYFLIINVVRSYSMLKRAITAIIVAGALLSGLALYQDLTGSYENQFGGLAQRASRLEAMDRAEGGIGEEGWEREEFGDIDRAEGPLGDPNFFAQILIDLLPLALILMYIQNSRLWKILAGMGMLLVLTGLFLTYSRGAFITLCVLALVAVLFHIIKARYVLLSLLIIMVVIAITSPGYFSRIATIRGAQVLFGGKTDEQVDSVILSRATEMLSTLNVYLDHPILGVGPGQYARYYSLEYMSNVRIAQEQHGTRRGAHCLYLEIAAETGTLGFLSFMSIVFLMLSRLWRERCRWMGGRQEWIYLSLAFILSILGHLGTGVFLSFAYQRYYWTIMALAGATVRISRLESGGARTKAVSEFKSGE